MLNKAGTATYRRIARRYGADPNGAQGSLIELDTLTIAVETSATLAEGIARLQLLTGRRFVAVTNKETIAEAQRLTTGTSIGVMDSRGNVVTAAGMDHHTGNGAAESGAVQFGAAVASSPSIQESESISDESIG